MAIYELSGEIDQTTQLIIPIPTGGVTKGELIAVNDVVGFPLATVAPIGTGEYEIESVRYFTLVTDSDNVTAEKKVGAINAGAKVYADAITDQITTAPTGNRFVGYALHAALSADTHVRIRFMGGPLNV